MRCQVVFTCWFAAGTQASAFGTLTPIIWKGHPAGNFALSPPALPNRLAVSTQVPKLRIWDQHSDIPKFTLRQDGTIAVDKNLCVEAAGTKSRDYVFVNHCTAKPTQLWNFVNVGTESAKHLQLSGTNKCIDVNIEGAVNGAPIELRECDNTETQSWQFEESVPVQKSFLEQLRTVSYPSRHVLTSLLGMCVLGAVSLTAWVLYWVQKAHLIDVRQNSEPSSLDEGGVCLTETLAVYQGHGTSDMTLTRTVPLSARTTLKTVNIKRNERMKVPQEIKRMMKKNLHCMQTRARVGTVRMQAAEGQMQEQTKKQAGVAVRARPKTDVDTEKKTDKSWSVLIHNDDIHTWEFVVDAIITTVKNVSSKDAWKITMATHHSGVGEVTKTWKQQAKIYSMKLQKAGLTSSIKQKDDDDDKKEEGSGDDGPGPEV